MIDTTDDGFIIETRPAGGEAPRPLTFLVLATDETEALGLIEADYPGAELRIAASGSDIRAQAARLGIEPGTYRQT